MKKLIFVSGGVCSSLGKGVAASSMGALMEARGLNVRMIKIDPYINVDAGTMSPYQHGEVYVTDDGAETDLDLGNYARFTRSPLSRANSITTGQIYRDVITKEREGRYLGHTVQVIPHITDNIKERIRQVMADPDADITIVEIGGTVGDIESIPFLEAARQMIHELGHRDCLSVHLTLIPQVSGGELKTKPTQHSVKELQEMGIQPDILLCRCSEPMDEAMRKKISSFTNVEFEAVISAHDVAPTIYELPLTFHAQNMDGIVLKKLGVESRHADLDPWKRVMDRVKSPSGAVRIGFVGKYMDLHDAYKSVFEALFHGGIANSVTVELIKLDSSLFEKGQDGKGKDPASMLQGIHGVLIPGGFGERGIEGMVAAARVARESGIPLFGICLGLQIMVIEYARSVLGWKDAHSTEFDSSTAHPVVSLLEEQRSVVDYGGTMRLGLSLSKLKEGTKIFQAFGSATIHERHRHRYEVANKYRAELEAAGLVISGTTENGELVESVQWPDHPWGVGVQFHPEFKSSPIQPHPLFAAFIKAAKERAAK
jgi:CTP synthase